MLPTVERSDGVEYAKPVSDIKKIYITELKYSSYQIPCDGDVDTNCAEISTVRSVKASSE